MKPTPHLIWRTEEGSRHITAYSGDLRVGSVYQLSTDNRTVRWAWRIDAVFTKWITQGSGARNAPRAAMRALDKAWADWLMHAALAPPKAA